MAVIDLCGQSGVSGNTGGIKCDPKRGNAQAILVGGAEFTPNQFATSAAFKTALLAAINKGAGESGKLFPFPEITTVAENTEANRTATLGNGTIIPLGEGRPSYTFSSYTGTNQEKSLRKFNNQTVPVFVFDDAGNIWGKVNSAGNFVGIPANLFTRGAGFGDFASAKEVQTTVSFTSAKDFFDFAAFANTDFNVNDLEGLLDVTLSKVAVSTGNTHTIGARIKTSQLSGDVNLYATYDDVLDDITAWVGTTAAGVEVNPTSAVKDDPNGGWTLTFGAAVTLVNLAKPSVLAGLGVTGLEGIPLSVVA